MSNLIYLKTFIEVVRARGFSAASKSLGVPRSTISLHVKRLEESLGIRLLKRSTRSVAVTDEGQLLFDSSNDSLQHLIASMEAAKDQASTLKGLIRLTAPADFPTALLSRAIVEFTNIHPDIHFSVVLTSESLNLVDNNIDLALGFSQRGDGNRVKRTAKRISWGFFASQEWLSKNYRPETIADISEFLSPHSQLRCFLEHVVLNGQRLPRGSVETNNQLMLKDLVLEGKGVGLLPEGLVAQELVAGRVERLLEDIPSVQAELTIEFPSRADISPRVRIFADHLISVLNR